MELKPWLQRWSESPDTEYRLVCFPHAGGSASFYRDWSGRLPEADVLGVCYPGRAERIADPLAEDLRALAYDIADALRPFTDLPLVLFGHSMGAPIALEAARRLETSGLRVAHLIASGSRDAPLPEPGELHENEESVLGQLAAMGGTSREMLDDEIFRELVLPYVMGDSRMFHAYAMAPGPVLQCPVTVLTGDQDEEADCRPWSTLTAGPLRQLTVRGGHFYLTEEPPFEFLRGTVPASSATHARTPRP
ncbi:thioesterase II family protein [Streptomyces mesophilus]|uniref:thioesterase II family protein n=1 Tax=Streptomyces mesophilus TaxID=1775132 RepID=UPI003332EB9E